MTKNKQPKNANSVFVHALEFNNVNKIVDLHIEVFPDYFLTHLGRGILLLFYSHFVNNRNNIAVLAEVSGSPVGFVSGVLKPSEFYREFYKRHFFTIAVTVFVRMFLSNVVRAGVCERVGQIIPAFISRFGVSNRESSDARESDISFGINARLLSIGLVGDFRGTGIAEKMVSCFCNLAASKGADTVGLTVFLSNLSAIRFYEKNGWQKESTNATEVAYRRSVSVE